MAIPHFAGFDRLTPLPFDRLRQLDKRDIKGLNEPQHRGPGRVRLGKLDASVGAQCQAGADRYLFLGFLAPEAQTPQNLRKRLVGRRVGGRHRVGNIPRAALFRLQSPRRIADSARDTVCSGPHRALVGAPPIPTVPEAGQASCFTPAGDAREGCRLGSHAHDSRSAAAFSEDGAPRRIGVRANRASTLLCSSRSPGRRGARAGRPVSSRRVARRAADALQQFVRAPASRTRLVALERRKPPASERDEGLGSAIRLLSGAMCASREHGAWAYRRGTSRTVRADIPTTPARLPGSPTAYSTVAPRAPRAA